MSKDIVSLIAEDLVKGLPEDVPDNIFIYGGGDIAQSVIDQVRLRIDSSITDGPSGSDYMICLDYFVQMYKTS